MFNDRLREARKKAGYSQEKLGQMLNVSKQTISDYEKGKTEPDMATVALAMKVLSIDANYLWQDEMKEETEPTYSIAALRVADVYDTLTEAGQQLIDQIIDFASKHHSNLSK